MLRIGLLTSVGLGALTVSAGLATAQDAFDWTGFYVGGAIGGGVIHDQTTINGNDDYAYTEGALTALLTAGVNWQDGSLVYGVEGDIGLVANGDAESDEVDPTLVSLSMSPVATLRGRLGFAAENFLLYGTAGLAIANFEIDDGYNGYSVDKVSVGGVIGVGAELAINDNMSIKAEGRVMGFDVESPDPYGNNVNSAVGLVGVNFHF